MSLVYICMNGTASQYFQELIPCYLPVRHLQSSTLCRVRIPSLERGGGGGLGVGTFSNAAANL